MHAWVSRLVSPASLLRNWEPTFPRVFSFALFLGIVLFLRPWTTNFVFDEQEALLANPYLDGSDASVLDVLSVDFWGRDPGETIGSYRPLPNLLWRALSFSLAWNTPFVFLLLNLVVHAATTGLLVLNLRLVLGRSSASSHLVPWFTALFFASCAHSAEAVCNAVGLSDLLVGLTTAGGFWALLRCLSARESRAVDRSIVWACIAFAFMVLGCFSKESMVGSLAVFCVAAWVAGRRLGWPRRACLASALVACVASIAALALYVATRTHFFPAASASAHTHVGEGGLSWLFRVVFRWFDPPTMPDDLQNNPLFSAPSSLRLPTAARGFGEHLLQCFVPLYHLGDSSFPRRLPEPWSVRAVAGGLLACVAATAGAWSLRCGERTSSLSWGAFFAGATLVSYLPVSNAWVLLPTIFAERLFYPPTVFLILSVGCFAGAAQEGVLARGPIPAPLAKPFLAPLFLMLALQVVQARRFSMHYWDDLSFWRGAAAIQPQSAKSVLNLGIMLGARGDLDARLRYSQRAVELAPRWALAQIYLGDAHCRLGDLRAARAPYLRGLSLAPNRKSLAALALQCIWDRDAYDELRPFLVPIAARAPQSWLRFFLDELDAHGEENRGLPARYRPRAYNRPTRNGPVAPGSNQIQRSP